MGTDAEGQGNDPTDGDSDDSEDSENGEVSVQLCLNCEQQLRCSYEPGVGYTCHLCTVIRRLQETLRLAREQNVDIGPDRSLRAALDGGRAILLRFAA